MSIGSGNGLGPARHQAIIWTNDDPNCQQIRDECDNVICVQHTRILLWPSGMNMNHWFCSTPGAAMMCFALYTSDGYWLDICPRTNYYSSILLLVSRWLINTLSNWSDGRLLLKTWVGRLKVMMNLLYKIVYLLLINELRLMPELHQAKCCIGCWIQMTSVAGQASTL